MILESCIWQDSGLLLAYSARTGNTPIQMGTCRMAFMYDVEGALIRKIKLLRINDLALTRDGTVMVMVTQEKLIKVQRLLFDGKDVRSATRSL